MKFNYEKTKFVLLFLIIPIIIFYYSFNNVFADTITSEVTIGNSAPVITIALENNSGLGHQNTTPINEGITMGFTGTANDSNGDSYHFIFCKTDSVTAVDGNSVPTCPGGQFCVTTLGTGARSCTFSTSGLTAEVQNWYAFACDNNTPSSCSSSSQGTASGDDFNSPFYVNHAPVFGAISRNSPVNPGATVTFSTSTSVKDNDTNGTADTVKLIICRTAGITNDTCDGGGSDTWCSSSFVASNPSCSFSSDLPSIGTQNAYTYLVDNHYMSSNNPNQGANNSFSVNNIAPVISNININSGSDITLTENTTTPVDITATITDNNSCEDITISSTLVDLYRSGVGQPSCSTNSSDNTNNCYADETCTINTGTCTGSSDASLNITCSINLQYYAEPTDVGSTYQAQTWVATVTTEDSVFNTDLETIGTGVELNTLIGYAVTNSINYGNLNAGDSNDPIDQDVNIAATGNVGLDLEVSGTNLSDGGTETIDVSQQKYALVVSTAYASGTILTTSPVEEEFNLTKTTQSFNQSNDDIYFGLEVPLGTIAGSYTGIVTLVGVADD